MMTSSTPASTDQSSPQAELGAHAPSAFPSTFLNSSLGFRPRKPAPEDHSLTPVDKYDLNCLIDVPVLQTDRVRLEPLIPSIHGPQGLSPSTIKWAESIRSQPNRCVWIIRDLATNQLAGNIGFDLITPTHRSVELAYVEIEPKWRRTHVQTHASWLLLKYALDKEGDVGGDGEGVGLGYVRVVWWCDEGNGPSERAAERLGMNREGVLRWCYLMPVGAGEGKLAPAGDKVGNDGVFFSMTWEDWLKDGQRERLEGMLTRRE